MIVAKAVLEEVNMLVGHTTSATHTESEIQPLNKGLQVKEW